MSMAGCWPRSQPGASSTRFHTLACQSARSRGTPPAGTTPTRWRLAAAGGRGFNPVDDNEADALALLAWDLEHPELATEPASAWLPHLNEGNVMKEAQS
jgi:hypothetical protein